MRAASARSRFRSCLAAAFLNWTSYAFDEPIAGAYLRPTLRASDVLEGYRFACRILSAALAAHLHELLRVGKDEVLGVFH